MDLFSITFSKKQQNMIKKKKTKSSKKNKIMKIFGYEPLQTLPFTALHSTETQAVLGGVWYSSSRWLEIWIIGAYF